MSPTPGSRLAAIHAGTDQVIERATCNYGLWPEVQSIADSRGMICAAVDDSGEVRAVERPGHPLFLATLYQPQLGSGPGRPHPVFVALVEAVVDPDPVVVGLRTEATELRQRIRHLTAILEDLPVSEQATGAGLDELLRCRIALDQLERRLDNRFSDRAEV